MLTWKHDQRQPTRSWRRNEPRKYQVDCGVLDRKILHHSITQKENKMSKTSFIITIALLTILVATIAVTYSISSTSASIPESGPERGSLSAANEAGMQVYQQSELADYGRGYSRLNAEGLAIYQKSERKSTSVEPAVFNELGLTVYQESERQSVEMPAVRLYDGNPFNPYQRSEWLGAER